VPGTRGAEADDLLFELGSSEQQAFRLVQLGRFDEALEIARQHFIGLPGLIIRFADALVEAEVVCRWGLRGVLSFEASQHISDENGALGLQENVRFIDACRERSGLVSGLMCFHLQPGHAAERRSAHAAGCLQLARPNPALPQPAAHQRRRDSPRHSSIPDLSPYLPH
jgi:hypothetical protein